MQWTTGFKHTKSR